MFTMIRPTRNWADGTDELSIEVVAPPFYKQRLGLTPTACVRCRVKKMKCTGEPHGCRGCLAKEVECTYPTVAKRNSPEPEGNPVNEPPQKQQRHQNKAQQQKQQVLSIHDPHRIPSQNTAQPNLLLASNSRMGSPELDLDDFIDFQSTEAFDRVEEPTHILPDMFPTQGHDGPQEAPCPGAAEPQYHPVKRGAALPSPEDTTVETPAESPRVPKKHCQVRPRTPSCDGRNTSCVDDALVAYDAIRLDTALWILEHDSSDSGGSSSSSDDETDEASTRHCPVSAYDLLGSQKNAMAVSEALLGCARCRSRSEALTMLVSLAESILATIESLRLPPVAQIADAGSERASQSGRRGQASGSLSPDRGRDRAGGWDRGRDAGRHGGHRAHTKRATPSHDRPMGDVGLLVPLLGNGPLSSSSLSSSSPSSSRAWILDPDEERHLFHGLLISRLGRLERLLATLERQIPQRRRGTAHRVLLHGLRSRFLREREVLSADAYRSAISSPSTTYRGRGPETPSQCRWL